VWSTQGCSLRSQVRQESVRCSASSTSDCINLNICTNNKSVCHTVLGPCLSCISMKTWISTQSGCLETLAYCHSLGHCTQDLRLPEQPLRCDVYIPVNTNNYIARPPRIESSKIMIPSSRSSMPITYFKGQSSHGDRSRLRPGSCQKRGSRVYII
jgi:hypothetical protein